MAAVGAAMACMCGAGAVSASAATNIANAGPFTIAVHNVQASLGGMPLIGGLSDPLPVTGTMAPDGTFTTNAFDPVPATMPDNSFSAGSGVFQATIHDQSLSVHVAPSSGTLDPASGDATFTLPIYGTLSASVNWSLKVGSITESASTTASCSFASAGSPQDFLLSTTGGTLYDQVSGGFSLVSAPVTTADPDCTLGSSYTSDVADPIVNALKGELVGSSNAGAASMDGSFEPAFFTAPVGGTPPGGGGGGGGGGGTGTTPPAQTPAVNCVVPKLGHSSLKTIRRKLAANHCKLGKITRRHSRKFGKNRVLTQKLHPGQTLPAGSAVPVTLSSGKPKLRRHH
jgi:hypothetical protein